MRLVACLKSGQCQVIGQRSPQGRRIWWQDTLYPYFSGNRGMRIQSPYSDSGAMASFFVYSSRKACIGSSRAARSAGMSEAAADIRITRITTPASVAAS